MRLAQVFSASTELSEEDGLIWKEALRTGTVAMTPGANQKPKNKPLVIRYEDDPEANISLSRLVRAFEEGAVEHVTVPLSHADRVDENTGYVERLRVIDDPERPGEKRLLAGIRFTEPDIADKVRRGSIANTSVGVQFDYTRKLDGKGYQQVLQHIALTNRPWISGLKPFGLSEEGIEADEIVCFSSNLDRAVALRDVMMRMTAAYEEGEESFKKCCCELMDCGHDPEDCDCSVEDWLKDMMSGEHDDYVSEQWDEVQTGFAALLKNVNKNVHGITMSDNALGWNPPVIELSAASAKTPLPGGTPEKDNWVDYAGGLPGYIREVAHHLLKKGHSKSRAIAIAVSRVKYWAATSKDPRVKAKAIKAIAEWERKKKRGGNAMKKANSVAKKLDMSADLRRASDRRIELAERRVKPYMRGGRPVNGYIARSLASSPIRKDGFDDHVGWVVDASNQSISYTPGDDHIKVQSGSKGISYKIPLKGRRPSELFQAWANDNFNRGWLVEDAEANS